MTTKPQKPMGKPQTEPLKKPQKSRKKPQAQGPQKPMGKPQAEPLPAPTTKPQKEADLSPGSLKIEKSDPSSETFGTASKESEEKDMKDLLSEAAGLSDLQSHAAPQDPPAPGAAEASGSAVVEVQDAFADTIAGIYFSVLRMGTQIAAKADLSPMTSDQQKRLSGAMKVVAAKHLPSVLLGAQEEMGLAGITVEIVMTNIKKPEQTTDGQQDHSGSGS